ncbi:hypothetical protein ACQUQU_01205 [Thalassolituus sp. LLYu03]|uniref:hypothetical protein n=1 Tax=Thalassolituus sp. LLYu03 TaxID=3421656 RepID=UPI003D2957BC
MRRLSLSLLFICLPLQAADWQSYPSELAQFDYAGDALAQHWSQLSAGPQLPFPDSTTLESLFTRYPGLRDASLQQAASHPALTALAEGNLTPLAEAIQQVWRLHYQGRFQQAYELGLQLGPVGAVPALYAKNMYATLLVSGREEKLALFREAVAESERLLPLAPDYPFARFGLVYAQARILELLETSEATSSGYLGESRATLKALTGEEPANALYPAVLAGIDAGVVERVGSFIGRITYGSTADKADAEFRHALSLQNQLPVIYNEYAKALGQMDAEEYHARRLELLSTCTALPVFSAEEAMNQAACSRQLTEVTKEH